MPTSGGGGGAHFPPRAKCGNRLVPRAPARPSAPFPSTTYPQSSAYLCSLSERSHVAMSFSTAGSKFSSSFGCGSAGGFRTDPDRLSQAASTGFRAYSPGGGLNRNHHHGRFFPQKGTPLAAVLMPSPHGQLEGTPLTDS